MASAKQKLIRLTTISGSLNDLLKGQLRFLSDYYEVVGVASDKGTGRLKEVSEREGVRCIDIPMHREISLLNDVKSLWKLIRLFKRENHISSMPIRLKEVCLLWWQLGLFVCHTASIR